MNTDNTTTMINDENLDTLTLKAIIDYCKSKYQEASNNYKSTGYEYFNNKCDAYDDVICYCIHQRINNCKREFDNIKHELDNIK